MNLDLVGIDVIIYKKNFKRRPPCQFTNTSAKPAVIVLKN